MAHLISFGGKRPRVAPDAYIAPTAVLIGDVVIETGASVWFGAVLRGDFDRIVLGAGSNIQDNAVLHTSEGRPTLVGPGVTVGHAALLEGCVIEEGALIGMGGIVLSGARVGRRALVAAGSVVREGQVIPPDVLAAGVPATVKSALSDHAREHAASAAHEYQLLRLRYMAEARQTDMPE
jgi:carbonic anhydrase/acetyltransferase-like protein (isoleucine patch superfamily)